MVSLIGCWLTLAWIDQVVGFDLLLLLLLLLFFFFSFFFFFYGIGLEHERDKETKILETWSPKRKKK